MSATKRPNWGDAAAAADGLRRAERWLLHLLGRLPLIPIGPLARLAGAADSAGVYRRLDGLRRVGLVMPLHAPLGECRSAQLWHPTDLGLAALARDRGVNPAALARANGLGRAALLAALRGLPGLLDLYRLLGALAAGGAGRPALLVWARPWRGTYARTRAGKPGTLLLPGYPALAWRPGKRGDAGKEDTGRWGEYLLIPDPAPAPLRAWREPLGRLFACRAALRREGRALPALVVATDAGRAGAWQRLLDEVRATRREESLSAHVMAWDDLDAGARVIAARAEAVRAPEDRLTNGAGVPFAVPTPDRPVPRLVGGDLARGGGDPSGGGDRRSLALALGPAEWDLLDLIARRPFLPRGAATRALGWTDAALRRRRNALVRRGLLRLVGADELGRRRGARRGAGREQWRRLAARELAEATPAGLAAVAAWRGLTLSAAVALNGFAGSGPSAPVGARVGLLASLEHTLGVEELIAGLSRGARAAAMRRWWSGATRRPAPGGGCARTATGSTAAAPSATASSSSTTGARWAGATGPARSRRTTTTATAGTSGATTTGSRRS